MKIGVIGLGAAARNIHIPAIGKIDRLELVGGVDPAVSKNDFPFPVFKSLKQLAENAAPDIICIVTPPDSHFDLIRESLELQAHVFCEKPFVLNMEQGREVVALARKADRHVVINNEFRFMNAHEAAREKIGTPDFGDLLFISINQTFFTTEETEAGWRGESNQRTCFEFGTHALDLCRYFFGENPHAISARMPKPGKPDGPDYLNLIQLEFSGDRVAHITLDRLSRGPHRYLDMRLDGTAACIDTRVGGKAEFALSIRGGSKKPYARLDFAPSASADLYVGDKRKRLATDPLDLFPNATAKLLEKMLEAIESGAQAPCNAEDNLATLALMLAAYESSSNGGTFIKLQT